MCEGVTRECMPPHDHERPTLYLGASLAFERTTEHKSFRIPGTPVSGFVCEHRVGSLRDFDQRLYLRFHRSEARQNSITFAGWSDDFCSYTSCDGRKPCVCRQLDCVSFLRDRAHPSSPRPVRRTGATAEGRRGVCAVSRSRARVSRCARGVAAGFAVPGLSKTLVRAPRAGDPAGGVGCASAYGLRS